MNEKNPHLFTLATLTGHEVLSYGFYSAIMDNGPAHDARSAERIQVYGDEFGQPVEISRLHIEVVAFSLSVLPRHHDFCFEKPVFRITNLWMQNVNVQM